ncbi:alpha/beta hydrolase family protein [Curtobacterium ammoniigenes]|uniref:alpha/beta hydrolase family protein n=1 Tax=Curtobacterium ammoniigenes TaxID=395387 RepID=UPI0008362E11|nr:chlorophyllase [Curtobacterium ammoniigenes]
MSQIIAVKPVTLATPPRGTDLQTRVSAPTAGTNLPVIIFAHGFGLALDAYDPLVDHWAASGFVVVQPTFLDSASLGLGPADPRYRTIWRQRVDDLETVIDNLPELLEAVPGLAQRTDVGRLAVAGHSWGGQSVGMLLGARVIDEDGKPGPSRFDGRVTAGVLLATTGTGGDDLSPFAQENFPFMSPDFSDLRTPSLVVWGDHDQSPLSTRGPDWFTDVFRLSPGARALVTVHGGEHSLGGIHRYGAADTTDESPARVDLVRTASTAFLRKELGIDTEAWGSLLNDPTAIDPTVGRVDEKPVEDGSPAIS